MSTWQTEANSYMYILGYWRSLWSSMDFADQTLNNCVNIIHTDIVEIWNMNDRTRVSSPVLLYRFSRSRVLVSNEPRICGKDVSHCQGLGGLRWRCATEVSLLRMTRRSTNLIPDCPDPSGPGDKAAEWVYDVYRGR